MLKNHIFFLVLVFPCFLWAQKKPQKVKLRHADKIQRFKDKYKGNLLLSGNVALEHNGAVLKADSVLLDEVNNYFHAFSNVVMTMENRKLQSDDFNYSGDTQLAQASGNVVLRDEEQTLYTDKLEYNRITNKAYYNTGGTIVSKENTINSQVGIYDLTTNTNTFDDDVIIENKDYFITSKNINHHSDGDYMEFFDETFIQSRENPQQFIRTNKGKYYFNKEEAILENRSSVHIDGKILTADHLYFNQATGYGKGTGDVLIDDPEGKRYIKGDYGEAFQEMDSAFVTQNAMAVRIFENDSLYLHADTLMATGKENNKKIKAFHNAKFFKTNLQGKADSISFSEDQGEINFYRNPIIWNEYRQITGDTITVYANLVAERLDSVWVKKNAFAVSKTDSITTTQFNQLKSRDMLGLFVDEQIDWVQAEGNAQSLAYMIDENEKKNTKELVGINRSDCGIIEADFEARDLNVVSCRINAESKLYPPSKLDEKERLLPDFSWREKERPLRWQDIFLVEN